MKEWKKYFKNKNNQIYISWMSSFPSYMLKGSTEFLKVNICVATRLLGVVYNHISGPK